VSPEALRHPARRPAATAAAAPERPRFAIGGIDEKRLADEQAAGATRVVVGRAATEAADPQTAASRLAAALRPKGK